MLQSMWVPSVGRWSIPTSPTRLRDHSHPPARSVSRNGQVQVRCVHPRWLSADSTFLNRPEGMLFSVGGVGHSPQPDIVNPILDLAKTCRPKGAAFSS